jgi:hypothetical protein
MGHDRVVVVSEQLDRCCHGLGLRYSVVRLGLLCNASCVPIYRLRLCPSPWRCGVDPAAGGGGGGPGRARDLRRLSGKDGPGAASLAALMRRERAWRCTSASRYIWWCIHQS